MKRLDILTNKSPNFIGCWNFEDKKIFNEIINFFDENKSLQKQGLTSKGFKPDDKKCIDIGINPIDLENDKYLVFKAYFKLLNESYLDYQKQWPFVKTIFNKIHIGSFNVQKYSEGGHFGKLHSEKTNIGSLHRIFAWMTYLNDVDNGGNTNFEFYNLKIKPETGKTLIWPADWTHAHTGEILNKGSKYIITGWMHLDL
jgi:prolyl 4-hydroxylase|tara:strand:+ start:738 stop:1334 length:597 start_codon:yes stop_codon:yes gene_type:complete